MSSPSEATTPLDVPSKSQPSGDHGGGGGGGGEPVAGGRGDYISAQAGITANGTAAQSADGSPADQSPWSTSEEVKTPGVAPGSASPMILSRNASFSTTNSAYGDPGESELPPVDKLTVFDFLENLALPHALEKLQASLSYQKGKVDRQRERLRQQSAKARERVDEWRKKVPPSADERIRRYRKVIGASVERLDNRLSSKNVTVGEKLSFIVGVLNIFITGWLVGAVPEYMHYWYTVQLIYFYPIRYYKYHKIGYHYFLADLCYFVNLLLFLSIWVFPRSKRLFISTFCLGFGNNAIAIAMWRNSLVFHSLDKITTLFIHIMPCVTLHCLVHLVPEAMQAERFPAVYAVKHASPTDPQRYGLLSMFLWSSIPYFFWQLTYHFFITLRRADRIAAGRPTSFTWLRRSYAPTWIGKLVLSLPANLQNTAFMSIQYCYALLTMVPAPIWLWYRWASASFLMSVFTWSVYNGAVYYIDIFGTRFQKELEQLKKDVAKWQMSPDIMARSPKTPFYIQGGAAGEGPKDYMSAGGAAGAGYVMTPGVGAGELNLGAAAMDVTGAGGAAPAAAGAAAATMGHRHKESVGSVLSDASSLGGGGGGEPASDAGKEARSSSTGYLGGGGFESTLTQRK